MLATCTDPFEDLAWAEFVTRGGACTFRSFYNKLILKFWIRQPDWAAVGKVDVPS
jgi:hypothetical protein